MLRSRFLKLSHKFLNMSPHLLTRIKSTSLVQTQLPLSGSLNPHYYASYSENQLWTACGALGSTLSQVPQLTSLSMPINLSDGFSWNSVPILKHGLKFLKLYKLNGDDSRGFVKAVDRLFLYLRYWRSAVKSENVNWLYVERLLGDLQDARAAQMVRDTN
ncbi:hypothetical protein CPB83DRAFT_855461 [Crepidotus variabilis]|uniref:Uncharacterized protein n=1 Tax=Crepidotus variabilis TaxID=179855 RepID=A0A9P6EEC1_9AGAR|nr:hypothetical protein CPB83DRAFT_855461 [Crepidotus variabilis]